MKSIFQLFGITTNFSRFIEVNDLDFPKIDPVSKSDTEICLLFLSTKKDFETLGASITTAIASLSNFSIRNISLIVPDHEVDTVPNEVQLINNLDIQAESRFITDVQKEKIERTFGARKGWALQQILKFAYIMESEAVGVLVVDSDTLLTSKREWLSKDRGQVLTPTWEYHQPYYNFLRLLGFDYGIPKYTFVAHHMLIQPFFYREAIAKTQIVDVNTLIEFLADHYYGNEASPFSIDYELYAQYVFANYPSKVRLQKWANIHSPMSYSDYASNNMIREQYSQKYASISFHSYS